MPVRKMGKYDEPEEEKVASFSSSQSIKPISIPLKQIMIVILVLGFVYQATSIYKESTIKTKAEIEHWNDCLETFVRGVCSAKVKKESIKDEKTCQEAYDCLHKGVETKGLMDLGSEATKQTGITFGLPALAGVMLYRMI